MGAAITSLVFRPPKPTTPKKVSDIIFLDTALGSRIPILFLKRPNATFTMLYSHTNGEDLGTTVYPWIRYLSKKLQVNILAYDYTGYGLSRSKSSSQFHPSEEHCYADIEACYHYLTAEERISPSKIILYGRSLGTGPSCHLAKKTADEGQSVAGLILHSPYLSIYRIVLETESTIYGDLFPNVDIVPFIRCPVLIIHGTDDRIVPHSHSEKLLKSFPSTCPRDTLLIDGMGHNHIGVKMRERITGRILNYFERLDQEQERNVVS